MTIHFIQTKHFLDFVICHRFNNTQAAKKTAQSYHFATKTDGL